MDARTPPIPTAPPPWFDALIGLNPRQELAGEHALRDHVRPGGDVADKFAGAISLHGFKHFDRQVASNDHPEHHVAMAQEMPLPFDGQVKQILDLDCGWGGFATALRGGSPTTTSKTR